MKHTITIEVDEEGNAMRVTSDTNGKPMKTHLIFGLLKHAQIVAEMEHIGNLMAQKKEKEEETA